METIMINRLADLKLAIKKHIETLASENPFEGHRILYRETWIDLDSMKIYNKGLSPDGKLIIEVTFCFGGTKTSITMTPYPLPLHISQTLVLLFTEITSLVQLICNDAVFFFSDFLFFSLFFGVVIGRCFLCFFLTNFNNKRKPKCYISYLFAKNFFSHIRIYIYYIKYIKI